MLIDEYSTTGVSIHPGGEIHRFWGEYLRCHLDNSIHFGPPAHSLGTLEQLPVELLHMILAAADLLSLTTFRRVSKNARQLVDSIPEYSTIIERVPILIRASLSIGSARWFSLRLLYETLCTAECETCGHFGGFIYIVTCQRACYECITHSTDYLMLLRRDAVRKFGITFKDLEAVPSIKCIPDSYFVPNWPECHSRAVIVDHLSARNTGIAVHGSVEAMERYASEAMSKKLKQYNERLRSRRYPKAKPRMPKCKDEYDWKADNIKRLMGVVRAPFLNTQDGSLAWGLQCEGCSGDDLRLYTEKTFLEHLEEYGDITSPLTRVSDWRHTRTSEREIHRPFRYPKEEDSYVFTSTLMRADRTGDIWTTHSIIRHLDD